MNQQPVLYSFRRCPYAMRARLALLAARMDVELREVVLRDKPAQMITFSPKATVPVLVLPDGHVLEESLDIIEWALEQNDPQGLLGFEPNEQKLLVNRMDAEFKPHLDGYKYPSRYPEEPLADHRAIGLDWINTHLTPRLSDTQNLFGTDVRFADFAIFPFIRQFAHVDRIWFASAAPDTVKSWLDRHLASEPFRQIMRKYPQWQSGDTGVRFPDPLI